MKQFPQIWHKSKIRGKVRLESDFSLICKKRQPDIGHSCSEILLQPINRQSKVVKHSSKFYHVRS